MTQTTLCLARPITRSLLSCFLLLFSMQLPGCNPSSAPEGRGGPDDSLYPIEGRILFRVTESYNCPEGECEPSVWLVMSTEKIYGCYNFDIRSLIHQAGTQVAVVLQGIYKPDLCMTAAGPATAAQALELAPGTYHLRYWLGDLVDRYDVTVTDDAIVVREVAAGFTHPLTYLTWRYPPKSFAYLCGTMTATSWICGDFLDSLQATGRFVEFAFPDSGSIPYPSESAGHYYDMPARYFRYETKADYDTAGAILGRYSRDVISQQQGVSLSLVNWKHRQYRSWFPGDWNRRETGRAK
jgi:hypothetical protein